MEDLENPTGKLWADNVARLNMTKDLTSKGLVAPSKALLAKKARLFNGALRGGGTLIYGEKLGQAKSKKEAIDAILGIMVGGLPMAFESAATITPTAQKQKDWADVIENGYKKVWL